LTYSYVCYHLSSLFIFLQWFNRGHHIISFWESCMERNVV
jgi:hypothetical protein